MADVENTDDSGVTETPDEKPAQATSTAGRKRAAKKAEKRKEEEKVESEEESEDEEMLGLFDKPVLVEGKRQRKSTVFLATETPQVQKESKAITSEGNGTPLGQIERVDYELKKSKPTDLKPLHRLLFGRDGRPTEIKKNIRLFNGFVLEKGTKAYESKMASVDRFTIDGLRRLCEILDVEKKGLKRDELMTAVMEFLLNPVSSGKPLPQPKKKKAKSKKRSGAKRKRSEGSKKGKSKSKDSDDDDDSDDEKEEEEDDEKEEEEEKDDEKDEEEDKKDADEDEEEAEPPKKRRKAPAKTEKKEKKAAPKSPKKKTPKKKDVVKIAPFKKKEKESPKKKKKAEKSKKVIVDDDSSDDEPLVKKVKKQPPTDEELEATVKDILDGADLEEVTMKTVCKQVFDKFPDFDLSARKSFVKDTVKKIIS